MEKKIKVLPFGTTPSNEIVNKYVFSNSKGITMAVLSYGGIVQSLLVPDRNGKPEDVVLGFDNLEDYILNNNPYFGAIIGRVGNRIAGGRFSLDGKEYILAKNAGVNHLHGGIQGFNAVVWDTEDISTPETPQLRLTYRSKDGEEGYPGNLDVEVIYALTENDAVEISYRAVTDSPTVVNLTHHSYFNLNPSSGSTILDHEVMIAASHYIPVDTEIIPLGDIDTVTGTPFDFRIPRKVGDRINEQHAQLIRSGGYDHCWVVDNFTGRIQKIATVSHPVNGRRMEVLTTEPGVQFYTGNFLDGSLSGKNRIPHFHRTGLCLETQHFPDAPNQPNFPSIVLKPDEVYNSRTIYKFSAQ